ncbi:TorD/DmsD family molecular chaperone [Gordonibacter sp. An230]|uniref:TorD/DmsD family molecular chaperone n=1 Tax=Gordonibacter sp. An230 TaxID=1965592 RepID=UPI001EF61373|nr:molecular chaperone TorD family protein [Gordonibacter sp. An230]
MLRFSTDEVCEPEGHLAFELEFMQLLGDRAVDALEAGDEDVRAQMLEARRAFLDEHVLNWVPAFAANVRRIVQTGFYRVLADIVVGVVEADRAFLDDALDLAAWQAERRLPGWQPFRRRSWAFGWVLRPHAPFRDLWRAVPVYDRASASFGISPGDEKRDVAVP